MARILGETRARRWLLSHMAGGIESVTI